MGKTFEDTLAAVQMARAAEHSADETHKALKDKYPYSPHEYRDKRTGNAARVARQAHSLAETAGRDLVAAVPEMRQGYKNLHHKQASKSEE